MSPTPSVEDIRNGFRTLEAGGSRATEVRFTSVVVAGGPVGQLSDTDHGRCLLIPVTDGNDPVSETPANGLSLHGRTLEDGPVQVRYQVVSCLEDRLEGTFIYFCTELLTALSSHPQDPPVQTCRRVIALWRDLLARGAADVLTLSALAGLVAELHFLEGVALAYGADHALGTWAAATGGRHDFRSGDNAVEVKATTGHDRVKVLIHGLRQLEPPEGGSLYLYAERLEAVGSTGDTVPAIVDRLDALGINRHGLVERLAARGYEGHDSHYAAAGFDLLDTRSVLVNDSFPALTTRTLSDPMIGQRVEDVRYTIDLTHEASLAGSIVAHGTLTAAMGPSA